MVTQKVTWKGNLKIECERTLTNIEQYRKQKHRSLRHNSKPKCKGSPTLNCEGTFNTEHSKEHWKSKLKGIYTSTIK